MSRSHDGRSLCCLPVCVAPCRLYSYAYQLPTCNGSTSAVHLQGDFSSSAEFFVCVGVFGFLYCTATLVLYLGYQSVYRQSARGPIIVSSRPAQVEPLFTFSMWQWWKWEDTLEVQLQTQDGAFHWFFNAKEGVQSLFFISVFHLLTNSCWRRSNCQTRTFFCFLRGISSHEWNDCSAKCCSPNLFVRCQLENGLSSPRQRLHICRHYNYFNSFGVPMKGRLDQRSCQMRFILYMFFCSPTTHLKLDFFGAVLRGNFTLASFLFSTFHESSLFLPLALSLDC